jgi:predicted dehydrogenase
MTRRANDRQINRRQFLGTTAAGVGAGMLASGLTPRTARSAARTPGANERIVMGTIGTGGMSCHHLGIYKEKFAKDVDVVAFCDIYEDRFNRAKEIFPDAKIYWDYRELLDRKDIDAVLIASPEHWHCQHLIDAVQAGKDAYSEKPLSHTLEQSAKMVEAVRKTDRIVQIGMQRRSTQSIILARQIVEGGALGEVALVRAWWFWNLPPMRTDRKFNGRLDWDKFQAPCKPEERVPPNPERYFDWRYFWAYSGGNLTDQGAHLMDVVQWFINDGEPPLAAQEHGAVYQKVGYQTPDTFCAVFEYPKFMATWTLTYDNEWQRAWGICFQGNRATLLLDDNGAKFYHEPWRAKADGSDPDPMAQVAGGLQVDEHQRNFIECVRSRKEPNAPVEVGQKAVAGLHVANLAHFAKRRVALDRDYVTTSM